ncbi:MAG TPA: HAD-IIA family hydrolase [Clostridiaceae bacterium]|nr:HAD-IIA family hydrolase [Clostridiaceae bacterium]
MGVYSKLVYLIDMDGTIYRGTCPIEYAKEFIRYLQQKNRIFFLVTNCPLNSAGALARKVQGMRIDVGPGNIITSADVTADYLVSSTSCSKAYVVGSDALKEKIAGRGIGIVSEGPDCVVVGYDTEFSYEKMKKATQFILDGAGFICTNGDSTIPDGNKLVPHTGAIAASIETASGTKPVVIGKPERYLLDTVSRRVKCKKEQFCVVGDRLDTDIYFGVKQNILSFLVLTGVTTIDDLKKSNIQPTKVFNNLCELMLFDEENN